MMGIEPIALLLITPLLWAVLTLLWPTRAQWLNLPGLLIQLAAAVILFNQVSAQGTQTLALGGWSAPLGIGLRADGLATTMLLLSSWLVSATFIYAARYFSAGSHNSLWFWPLAWFMNAALNSIWLATDLFNLYVGLELLGLAAVGLVALTGEARALAAALRYLLAALLGSLAYLLGVALLYGAHGTLALDGIALAASGGHRDAVALALMLAGLALKSAIFPLHGWLPPAHGGAPAPVSALLSALVVKASFFIMLRLWVALEPVFPSALPVNLLGLLGVAAMLWGSMMALRQFRLKMVVAWSTVAQLGYLMLFFPLFSVALESGREMALQGTGLQIIAHALAKAALFLAAGNLILATGRDHIQSLAGTGRFVPLTAFTMVLASVSLMGLPPSAGFLAKWLLVQSALTSGQWWWALALLLGGLLSAAYLFRVLREVFREGPQRDHFNHPPRILELSAFALALSATLLGLLAAGMVNLISGGPA